MRGIQHQAVLLFVLFIVMSFMSCDSSITNENTSDLKSALSETANGLLPTPVVEHTVGSFNPYFTWPIISGATAYKFRREKCCVTVSNFTISVSNLNVFYDNDDGVFKHSYQDGAIIHPQLEAVETAVPDKWIQYKIKAVFDDEEGGWTPWMYYTIPDETYW